MGASTKAGVPPGTVPMRGQVGDMLGPDPVSIIRGVVERRNPLEIMLGNVSSLVQGLIGQAGVSTRQPMLPMPDSRVMNIQGFPGGRPVTRIEELERSLLTLQRQLGARVGALETYGGRVEKEGHPHAIIRNMYRDIAGKVEGLTK